MAQVILTDWELCGNSMVHYSLDLWHKTQLEKVYDMKIVSFADLDPEDDVLFYWGNKFQMSLLKSFPNLKWLHLGSSGSDNIEIKDIQRSGVSLSTSRGFFKEQVSEYLLSMVLFSAKFPINAIFDSGKNSRINLENNSSLPILISDLKILVFGTGEIANFFKNLMLKLNVDIECVSISGRSGYKSWKELSYSTTYSHVISITALTQKTKSFFSKKMFENFCKGSVFINAGRGQVVDEHSLLDALENNIIKGAILDTHSEFSGDCSKLSYSEHPKVLCTPHIASWSDKFSEIQFNYLRNQTKHLHDD